MSGVRAVHQLVPRLAYGDAVGNQVLELRRLLREWGYVSEIYAEAWDKRLAGECRHFRRYAEVSHPRNLLILHYCAAGESNLYPLTLSDRVVLYYHNLTPAHFFYRTNGAFAAQLVELRWDLSRYAGRVPAWAASPYNQVELEALGFQVIGLAPYVLQFDALQRGLETPAAIELRRRYTAADTSTWLYVGRLAPNKRLEDTLAAFAHYQRNIQPRSRLLLVGSAVGNEQYVNELNHQIERLGLGSTVALPGHFGANEGLGVFYSLANIYVSFSEHEGFCVPLVEAMYFGVPVLAYAATGVPLTLGTAGVMFTRKAYPVIAEIADEMIGNAELRRQLIAGGRARLAEFAPEQAHALLRSSLQAVADK